MANYKFCPECGTHLTADSHEETPRRAAIKDEHVDDSADIRTKLGINGQPLNADFKLEPVDEKPSVESTLGQPLKADFKLEPKPPPPMPDEHAQAALNALRNRKEKQDAEAAAKVAGADEGGDDDDDVEQSDDDWADDAATTKRPAGTCKKPAASSKHVQKLVQKKVLKRPASNSKGCMRCRLMGRKTCDDQDFGGKHITRVDWLELGLK